MRYQAQHRGSAYECSVRPRRWLGVIAVSVGALIACFSPAASQDVPSPSQSVSAGSRVYGAKGCAECHAINGIGGTVGPDFGERRTRSLNALVAAMWGHLPQMTAQFASRGAPAPRLDPWEAADLLAFLFWASSASPVGDPEVGERLFTERTCIVCHQVKGVGGVLGPSLDGAGSKLTAIDLAAALWNHAGVMDDEIRARGLQRPVLIGADLDHLVAYFGAGLPGDEQVQVNVLSGDPDGGRALFRDRGCVQCHERGTGGAPNLTRVARRDPASFAAAMWNKSPRMMAAMRAQNRSVPRLTGAEMADLTAYLGALQYLEGQGSAARGPQAAAAAGCTSCHTVAGQGSGTAGALDRMRQIDTRAAVIAALWNHVGLPPGTLAARWRALSAAQVADLVAFFESRGAGR